MYSVCNTYLTTYSQYAEIQRSVQFKFKIFFVQTKQTQRSLCGVKENLKTVLLELCYIYLSQILTI